MHVQAGISTSIGTGSTPSAVPLSDFFFFFLAAFGLAELFSSVFSSGSVTECSDSYNSGSIGKPVILCGPLGIRSTVNLYWATISP